MLAGGTVHAFQRQLPNSKQLYASIEAHSTASVVRSAGEQEKEETITANVSYR